MANFSERNGYENPREVIIREQINEPVQNSIYNWITRIYDENCYASLFNRGDIERCVWVYFLNQRIDRFNSRDDIIRSYILDDANIWYKKLDLIELFYSLVREASSRVNLHIDYLNEEFQRHNFAYRMVDGHIVEVTSDEEIKSIEGALTTPIDGVKIHLQTALKHLSASQGEPDYRNSIKESISAVECYCRVVTGATTLGTALKNIEDKGVTINATLKLAMEKLYGYTNNPDTGIRHALLDDANPPTSAEAIYMLVTCSAFINYLTNKGITVKP